MIEVNCSHLVPQTEGFIILNLGCIEYSLRVNQRFAGNLHSCNYVRVNLTGFSQLHMKPRDIKTTHFHGINVLMRHHRRLEDQTDRDVSHAHLMHLLEQSIEYES